MKNISNRKNFFLSGRQYLANALECVGAWFAENQRRRRAFAAIEGMTHHDLRDIGLRKGEILLAPPMRRPTGGAGPAEWEELPELDDFAFA